MSKDDLGGLPYQQASVVRQLVAERTNAEALGLTDRVASANKQLEGLGWKDPEKAEKVSRDEPPVDRRAAHERTEKATEPELKSVRPAQGHRVQGKSRG